MPARGVLVIVVVVLALRGDGWLLRYALRMHP